MEAFVVAVMVALALLGLWADLTSVRDWWVTHQPKTKRGKRLRNAAITVGAMLVIVVMVGNCAAMFTVGP